MLWSLAMSLQSAPIPGRDLMSDTWTATDALGRSLPLAPDVRAPRPDKFVAAFYFLWMGEHGQDGPYDISRILQNDPDAMSKPQSTLWGAQHKFHFWGKPLFGYYLSDDRWVMRKHAEMLSAAGVDVVVFDCSNNFTYPQSYTALGETWSQIRSEGTTTPAIAFLTPFWNPASTTRELYENIYKPGLFSDLWFMWDGKPLILADPAKVDPGLREVFTFRKPQPEYWQGPTGPDQWSWLEIYPQHVYKNSRGEAEQMCVGVGQNARLGHNGPVAFSEQGTMGRSWHNGARDLSPGAVARGLNFAEQWQRALEADPKLLFITGWNEWIALRLPEFGKVREPIMFVDQYTQEFSRDVEPMSGGHGDNYYLQMVDGIRRFKGARPLPAAGPPRSINLDGGFAQWADVTPEYRDHVGDTAHRDHAGWGSEGRYVNTTGRNDIVATRVARDAQNIYFYVRTQDPITSCTDRNWMMLFINASGGTGHGWEGYDYVLNHRVPNATTTTLERSTGGWSWVTVADVPMRISGNELMMAVPRKALAMDGTEPLRFDFKWSDNMQADGDIMDFYVHGDSAPLGRFAYRYYEDGTR